MNDLNKTPLTHRITAVAVAALNAMGCKPVETEVPISPGWIADVASYWYPTRTEAKRFHLDKITMPTRLIDSDSDELEMRLRCWGPGPLTVAVEVKATRSDFSQDPKWSRPPPANICILVFPSGVVDEMPKGWFGVETNKQGDKAKKWHRTGEVHPQYQAVALDFVAQVGIRRDHRTRYRVMRDWSQAYRIKDAETRTYYSASRLLELLAAWLQREDPYADGSLRDNLASLGIVKPPSYLKVPIEYFETLRKTET